MVFGFLVHMTVDAADTPNVGVLSLLDNDTITDDKVVLIRIDNHVSTVHQVNRVLIQSALGMVLLNGTADQTASQHAQTAIGGRVRMRATDSLLLLAVLSAGEGDEDHARELLLTMGYPRHSQLAVYAEHFAARLGIGDERDQVRVFLFEDFGVEMRNRAITDLALLKDEMTRRGWL